MKEVLQPLNQKAKDVIVQVGERGAERHVAAALLLVCLSGRIGRAAGAAGGALPQPRHCA